MTEDLSKYKQPFDPDWPHGHTYLGRPVRIVATDVKGEFPILGLVQGQDGGCEWPVSFYADAVRDGLINAPAPKRTWWVNLYHDEFNSFECTGIKYVSREKADKCASSDRFACIKVTEGEGL